MAQNNETSRKREKAEERIRSLGKYSIGEIVKNNLDVKEVNPFDKALSYLHSQGYRVASAEEVASARMELRNRDIYGGGFLKEAVIYVPLKNEIILTRNSPIIAFAERAVSLERQGKGFYLTEAELEPFLEGSVNCSLENIAESVWGVLEGLHSVPTNNLENEPITSFLLGKKAKQYGEFLKSEFGLDYLYLNAFKMAERSSIEMWDVHQVSFDFASRGGFDFGCRASLHYDSLILGIK